MNNLEAKFKKVEDAWYEAEGKIFTLEHEKKILRNALEAIHIARAALGEIK